MCILLVEDEDLIRLVVAEGLADAGFEVCEAENGERAAEVIAAPPTALSLLVTDIHMPGRLDGLDVAQLMHRRYPNVPTIFITGRPDALHGMRQQGNTKAVLRKPFTPSELLAVIRRLLD